MTERRARKLTGTALAVFLAVFLGVCLSGAYAPSFAHEMPVEPWVLTLMPSCQQRIDGFSARAAAPYATWWKKHQDELADFAGLNAQGTQATTAMTAGSAAAPTAAQRSECEGLLSYLVDDMQPPDPRFASPEATWNLFLKAARAGDKPTMAECFAPFDRAQHMPMIEAMTTAQLAALAGSFTGFHATEPLCERVQEAWINRGEQAGMALFVKTGRGWRLSQPP